MDTADAESARTLGVSADGQEGLRPLGSMTGIVLRRLLWLLVVLVLAAYAGLVLFAPAGVGYVAGQWLFTLVAVFAAVGTGFAGAWTREIERRFWTTACIAGALIALSQCYYSAYVTFRDPAGPPVPSLSTWLDLTSIVLFIGLVTSLARLRHSSVLARVRYALDDVGVSLIAMGAVHALIVGPWYTRLGVTAAAPGLLASAYPVLGVHLLVGTLRSVVGPRYARWRSWEWLVVSGLACMSAGLVLWPVWYVSAHLGVGGPWATASAEVLWLAGVVLLLAAAVYRHTEWSQPWHLGPMPAMVRTSGWASAIVFPAVQLTAIPLFGWLAYRAVGDPALERTYMVATAVTVALVIARTGMAVVDNGHLLNRSVTDPLTGLFNHRHFHERLAAAVSTAERFGEEVSVGVLDLDDFNRVNAVRGHAAGDEALVDVATRLRSAAREADVVCRLGGDEFGIIFAGTGPDAARAVCGRVLDVLRMDRGANGDPLTASIGVAGYPLHAADRDELLKMADGAQYWAKYHGKDQVVLYDAEIVTALDAAERIRGLQDGMHLDTVRSLAAAVDARSPGMEHHSRNVAALVVLLAREVGLDERTATLLEVAALVHDVGKIGIPDRILNKRGPLTAEECQIVREHCVLGERVLQSTRLVEVLPWVRHHHEQWDGRGYPDGLAGEDIPIEARMLGICDAYDAMTSERTSRPALSKAAALQEIDLGLGTQFDPVLGEAFLRMAAGRRVL